jgi:SAM-dependent methyltransferase
MKAPLFEKILSILDLKPGTNHDILDVGCGSGDLLARISVTVSDESTLIGMDAMKNPVDEARALYPSIDFRHEKFIDSFGFPDASFDMVISVDTLECIPNKVAFVAETARILRPEGRILLAHWDWDTQVYNSEHKEIIRRFVAAFSDWQQGWMDACDGQMGRRLWGLFQGSGMFTGKMESFTLLETKYEKGRYGYDRLQDLGSLVKQGKLDGSQYDLILHEMATLNERSEYFYSVNSYIYFGTRT